MVGGERLEHGVPHGGRLLTEEGPQAELLDGVLLSAELGVEPDTEKASADEDATDLAEGRPGLPASFGEVAPAHSQQDDPCHHQNQATEDHLRSVKPAEDVAHVCIHCTKHAFEARGQPLRTKTPGDDRRTVMNQVAFEVLYVDMDAHGRPVVAEAALNPGLATIVRVATVVAEWQPTATGGAVARLFDRPRSYCRSRHPRGGGEDLGARREVTEVAPKGDLCVSNLTNLAERVGFEPTVSFPTHAFQACRFGRSRTPPGTSFVVRTRRRWPGDLRHSSGTAESCCLPALTRFTG